MSFPSKSSKGLCSPYRLISTFLDMVLRFLRPVYLYFFPTSLLMYLHIPFTFPLDWSTWYSSKCSRWIALLFSCSDHYLEVRWPFPFSNLSDLTHLHSEVHIYSSIILSMIVLCFVAQSCLTLCSPMDCSPPGSSVHGGFSRQEYWSGLPCPPPRGLPNPGNKPRSSALQAESLPSEPPGKPTFPISWIIIYFPNCHSPCSLYNSLLCSAFFMAYIAAILVKLWLLFVSTIWLIYNALRIGTMSQRYWINAVSGLHIGDQDYCYSFLIYGFPDLTYIWFPSYASFKCIFAYWFWLFIVLFSFNFWFPACMADGP